MEHQGERLKTIIKSKGFNMSELAAKFGLTRAAVDKHVRSERLTRKVLKPYAETLEFSLDTFFEQSNPDDYKSQKKPELLTKSANVQAIINGETVPAEIHLRLQSEYFDLLKRYNDLVVRFFPNAAHLVSIIS